MECRSFRPALGERPRLLILGSMPGIASLRKQEYYGFPHNVFWRLCGNLCHFDYRLPYAERVAALNRCGVALWDVLQCCEREGSLDTAIAAPEPNAIDVLVRENPSIERIGCNGGAAYKYFCRYFPELRERAVQLISTSPAAARWSFEEKLAQWRREIGEYIEPLV